MLILLLLAPYAVHIPLAVLAAILFVVAYNMSEAKHFIQLIRGAPRNDVVVLLITFSLTVFADLVIAVNIGVILAALLFMKKMSESVQIVGMSDEEIGVALPAYDQAQLPKDVKIYSIDGPFFFGAAETFERTLAALHEDVRVLIIRLGRVPFIDATAMNALEEMIMRLQKRHTRIMICEANPLVARKLAQAGIASQLGVENIHADLAGALNVAGIRPLNDDAPKVDY